MLRKYWILTILLGFVALLMVGFVFAQPLRNASASVNSAAAQVPQGPNTGVYMWSYSVKFVCGIQPKWVGTGGPLAGEPPVKPGNYATEINIHNNRYSSIIYYQKLLVLVDMQGNPVIAQQPQVASPTAFVSYDLPSDGGTMVDCNRIWTLIHSGVPLTAAPPIAIGYVVLLSANDIDVQAVYTAATPGDVTVDATGISLQILVVPGKRVFLPAGLP
jgi:hypothetical protein